MRKSLTLLAAAIASVAAACGTTTTSADAVLNLDRPVDIAFGCYGSLRITGGGREGDPADPITSTAMPITNCDTWTSAYQDGVLWTEDLLKPIGQADLSADGGVGLPAPTYYAFILQSVAGTLAIAQFPAKPPSLYTTAQVKLFDADPLTPGENSISIGSLPVAVAVDSSGCYAVTANAGTHDLSTLDITSAVNLDPNPIVNRLTVTNADGVDLDARPAAMLAQTPEGAIGAACPAAPQGIVYVAFPDCHMVAAIDLATGQIQGAIQMADDGTVTINTDGKVTCTATGARPTSLDLADDPRVGTRRLAIGAEDLGLVTVVDLDADFLPIDAAGSVTQVALEGDVGVTDVAITPQLGMGGTDSGEDAGPGGQFQFVYAVVDDGTVRVASILDVADQGECDTEVDPRFLLAETDLHKLACIHDDLTTPPRRATARSPGIQLVGRNRPVAVTVIHGLTRDVPDVPGPKALIGWFAMVTTTNGYVYVVNIDDRDYPDVYDPSSPLAVSLPLALPHQVRDAIASRDILSEETQTDADGNNPMQVPVCNNAGDPVDVTDPSTLTGGPRLAAITTGSSGLVRQALAASQVSGEKAFQLPNMRTVECTGADAEDGMPVWEMQFSAPVDVRASVFPDLRGMDADDVWTMTWEGPLSNDSIDRGHRRAVDPQRPGRGRRHRDADGGAVEAVLRDGGRALRRGRARGLRPVARRRPVRPGRDLLRPPGVDRRDRQLPADRAGRRAVGAVPGLPGVAAPLRGDRGQERRAAPDPAAPRPRHHAAVGLHLGRPVHRPRHPRRPARRRRQPGHRSHGRRHPPVSCMADPSRAPGPDRCVMACDADHACADGTICDGGVCVEGVVPPLQCLPGVQRYDVRASDAFTVIGSTAGYVHPITADPTTGECVRDPAASPLEIGRIPLTAPPCLGDGPTDFDPNPCSTTVSQTELEPDYADPMACTLTAAKTKLVTRDAPAIRFRNAQMTFTMVDPTYPGDKTCIGDRGGDLVDVPLVFPGYAIQFRTGAGFRPLELTGTGVAFPIDVIRGPQQSIWLIDEGDNLQNSPSTRGQVFRFESVNLETINTLR